MGCTDDVAATAESLSFSDPCGRFQKRLGASFVLIRGIQELAGIQLWVHLPLHVQEEED
jgi:hypothetical protein